MIPRPSHALLAGLLWLAASPAVAVDLVEKTDSRTFRTVSKLDVTGSLRTRSLDPKDNELPLRVEATHEYRSRRLPPAGRDARALRSLRHFDVATAKIVVAGNATTSELPSFRRTFVAEGRREGVRSWTPRDLPTTRELDLLDVPCDPLAILGLLPVDPKDVGDEWSPPTWSVQLLAGIEAVEDGDVRCKLASVADGTARVEFSGDVKGAQDGTRVELDFDGHYLFDVDGKYVRHVELKRADERSIGPVTPGMKVAATVTIDREPTSDRGSLTDEALEAIPLEADPGDLLVRHDLPWNAQMHLSRDWHPFHTTPTIAMLRLMRGGSLVAQCNVRRLEPAAPGKHASEKQFQDDVARALGERFEEIVKTEKLDPGDGRYVLRVVAKGKYEAAQPAEGKTGNEADGETATADAKPIPMTWIYYLVAAPSGRQFSYVFIVETELLPRLGDEDEAIVLATRFLEPNAPTPAEAAEK